MQIFLVVFIPYITSTFPYFFPFSIYSIRLWQGIWRWCHFRCRFTIWRRNFFCLTWCWLEFCKKNLNIFLSHSTITCPYFIPFSINSNRNSLSYHIWSRFFLRTGDGGVLLMFRHKLCLGQSFISSSSFGSDSSSSVSMGWF